MDYTKALLVIIPIIVSVVVVTLSVYRFSENRTMKRSEREKDLQLKEVELQAMKNGLIPNRANTRQAHQKLQIEIQHLKKLLGKKD